MCEENEYYIISSCPICRQGYVEIVKEQSTGTLFLCCDECEAEWSTPNDIGVYGKGSRQKYGRVTVPMFDEIKERGWDIYIKADI